MDAVSDDTRQRTLDLEVRAAWFYYVEGLTQEQTAQQMNISRARVIRLLAAARDGGVVRIRIDPRGSAQVALERRLIAAFGLAEAVVVPAPADEYAVSAVVGHAAVESEPLATAT